MKIILVTAMTLWTTFASAAAPRASAFELGRKHYESGDYPRALDLFSVAISSANDSSHRNRAYYYQGMALFEMGHYFSSYLSFRNVLMTADEKSKEIYEKAIKNAVTITDRLNMVDRIGKVLEKLPGTFIPVSVTGQAHYAIGAYQYAAGEMDMASSHFKSVHPENGFYPKALFYLGVISTKKKDYKEALAYFDRLATVTRGKKDLLSLGELGRLDMARTLYSMGDIERSIEVYSQFLSSSPHWLTVLLEASWPLMRVNDTTVSLGNLHTITSPFYREDMVGEAYILRTTILYSLCKYEEMRQTLSQFFTIYDPVTRAMEAEEKHLNDPGAYFTAFVTKKGLNRSFINYGKRDQGIVRELKVLDMLKEERRGLSKYQRNEQMHRMATVIEETEKTLSYEIGATLQKLHKMKLAELITQREQANYLKVEIVTGEKELIEGQKGLPPKRIVDVETSVASAYHFWPFKGEYWEDELGTYVYTTESSCVN